MGWKIVERRWKNSAEVFETMTKNRARFLGYLVIKLVRVLGHIDHMTFDVCGPCNPVILKGVCHFNKVVRFFAFI